MFRKFVEEVQDSLKFDKITGTLRDKQFTFVITSRLILVRMRNFRDKNCGENENTHFMFNNFFDLENRSVYEIRWKNIAEPGRPQMAIWCMHFAC